MADRLEAMLLEAGDDTSRWLRRAQRREISAEQYRQLVDWAGDLRISRGLSAVTVGRYVAYVAELFEWLNERGIEVGALTAQDAAAWVRDMYLDHRLRARTRGLKLSAARSFYGWREREGYGASPVREIAGPRRDTRAPRKFSTTELRKLFAAPDRDRVIGRRDYAVLLLTYATGARRQEIAALTLEQLVIRARSGRVRFHGKGAKEREVAFDRPVVDALMAWLADREHCPAVDPDAVFLGLTGHATGRQLSRSGIDQLVWRHCRKAGIRRRRDASRNVHRLRVTFATDMYDQGYDLEQIRVLMGHDDIETTRRYLAISERQQQVRLPATRLREVAGGGGHVPLWMRHKADAADE